MPQPATVINPKISSTPAFICSCLIFQPLQIFFINKQIFIFMFALLALPLSLLFFSRALAFHPIQSQILHLEFVASLSPTRFEARHVWKESREIAIALLHSNFLYSVPSFTLSLLAAVSSVVSAESGYHRNPISAKSVLNAIRSTWRRTLVTSIFVYVILFCYSSVPRTLWSLTGGGIFGSGFVIWVTGSALEIYLMAVLGMGLVVSILEERFGWDAIFIGSDLMEGKRVCGWVLSGLMGLVTGLIGWKMEGLKMDGEDSGKETRWKAVMLLKGWETLGVAVVYGVVMVWGYVVTTVFYCECRKQHVVWEVEGGSVQA
ncbi:hypothetical protein OIU84_000693 [Salix udensis]|uniref:Transmembrane protein n=1 Tax=Salix udensis TaxID=889485 RepID=A0AAD6L5R6_9ROSI|nr:hypothetical protein OIU84_000693 [Salix udensis]